MKTVKQFTDFDTIMSTANNLFIHLIGCWFI